MYPVGPYDSKVGDVMHSIPQGKAVMVFKCVFEGRAASSGLHLHNLHGTQLAVLLGAALCSFYAQRVWGSTRME